MQTCRRPDANQPHRRSLCAGLVSGTGIGALAGLAGDKWSLGFVAETEKQVCKHLEEHLQALPAADDRSRRILEQMHSDEGEHATVALEAGAASLPGPVRTAMSLMARVMKTAVYRL